MEYINISPATANFFDTLGLVIFFLIAGTFAVWIFICSLQYQEAKRGG